MQLVKISFVSSQDFQRFLDISSHLTFVVVGLELDYFCDSTNSPIYNWSESLFSIQ